MFLVFDVTEMLYHIKAIYNMSKTVSEFKNDYALAKSERNFREFFLYSFKHFFQKKGFHVKDYRRDSSFEYLYDQIGVELNTPLDLMYDVFFTHTSNLLFNFQYINNKHKPTNKVLSIMVLNNNLIIGEEEYEYW